jgi:probable HAF family extracellular repeat protein
MMTTTRSIAAVLAALVVHTAGATTYRVTAMPAYVGDDWPSINRSSQVAATQAEPNEDRRAYVWNAGQLTFLGTLGGDTVARGINRHGEVVGLSYVDDLHFHAFFWAGHEVQDIGTLGGSTSVATAINSRREISGYSRRTDGQTHAFARRQGVMTDLGTLGGRYSYGAAINEAGHVVGVSAAAAGPDRAFLHDGSSMLDLGAAPPSGWSRANALNDADDVVGASGPGQFDPYRATLFKAGQVIDLGTLGGAYSEALAINRQGHIVGWSTGSGSHGPGRTTKAFLYRDGQMISLNQRLDPVTGAGWLLRAATDINDRGEIVGWGHHDGVVSVFLLTPMRAP